MVEIKHWLQNEMIEVLQKTPGNFHFEYNGELLLDNFMICIDDIELYIKDDKVNIIIVHPEQYREMRLWNNQIFRLSTDKETILEQCIFAQLIRPYQTLISVNHRVNENNILIITEQKQLIKLALKSERKEKDNKESLMISRANVFLNKCGFRQYTCFHPYGYANIKNLIVDTDFETVRFEIDSHEGIKGNVKYHDANDNIFWGDIELKKLNEQQLSNILKVINDHGTE